MIVVGVGLFVSLVVCVPVPPATRNSLEDIRGQNHQVDNVEIHHDVDADTKNQELVNDLLPDHSQYGTKCQYCHVHYMSS